MWSPERGFSLVLQAENTPREEAGGSQVPGFTGAKAKEGSGVFRPDSCGGTTTGTRMPTPRQREDPDCKTGADKPAPPWSSGNTGCLSSEGPAALASER